MTRQGDLDVALREPGYGEIAEAAGGRESEIHVVDQRGQQPAQIAGVADFFHVGRPDVRCDRPGVHSLVEVGILAEPDRERRERPDIAGRVAGHSAGVESPAEVATHGDIAAAVDSHRVVHDPGQLGQEVSLPLRILVPVGDVPVSLDR